MLSVPHRSEAETRANASFEALLWALSRPGLPRSLPAPGEAPIIEALIDRECRVHCADPRLIPLAMQAGAEIAEIGQADHVFLGELSDPDPLLSVQLGSDLYPDDGATVVVQARFNSGPHLRLTGPGIDGALAVQIAGLPVGFWSTRARLIRYPMGFDLFLLDGDRVIGIPRSTTVEVL